MKRYTSTEKNNGEFAVRRLSDKARGVYNGTDPMSIFELDTDDGIRYDVRGLYDADSLTFDELQEFLEGIQDALDEY